MAVKLDNPTKFFNEYFFYQYLNGTNSVNQSREDAGLAPVKKRQALQLRDALTEALAAKGKTMGNAGKGVLIETISEVLKDAGVEKSQLPPEYADKFYGRVLGNFCRMTGLNSKAAAASSIGDIKDEVLPISPYDPNFSMRETCLDNGTALLYAKADDIAIALGAMPLTQDNVSGAFGEDMTLYRARQDDLSNGLRIAGSAYTTGDLSGYSLLSTLVPERNAREVRAFVNQDGSDNPVYADGEQVRKSFQVLSRLKEEGIDFSFKRDEKPGQLKAEVTMPGMPPVEVRVLDPVNPQYGGCSRIYTQGVQGYYSTDKTEDRENPVTHKMEKVIAGYNPTVKESVDLIKYSLGQQIMRGDGKPVGGPGVYGFGKYQKNESYHSGKSFSAVVRPYPDDKYAKVFIRMTSMKPSDDVHFKSADESDAYLMDAVQTARENYSGLIGLESLIEQANEHKDDADYVPAFSGNPEIAAMQSKYWEVLSGKTDELLQFDVNSEEFLDAIDGLDETGMRGTALEDFMRSSMAYVGTPEEKVRAHFADLMEEHIGTFLPDSDGVRFDPVTVSKYMTSPNGQFRNSSNIILALRSSGIKATELRGNEFYNQSIADKLIEFDHASARQMRFEKDPFMKTMFESVRDAVLENGCQITDKDILIDDNGIVQYTATKFTTRGIGEKGRKTVTGTIGQIFAPDERGLVTTKFAGSPNFKFAPGMTATVVPNKDGEDKPYEQRVRIKTYEMSMAEGIRHAIRADMMADVSETGSTTSLNGIPRRNQGVRFEEGELESKDPQLQEAIIAAETGRVTYSSEITSNAGRYDLYKYNHDDSRDPYDDVHIDAIQLMGGENYAILRPEESAGIFDPRATGTGPAQGCRYLVDGAKVGPDGFIIPATKDDGTIDADARNGLSKYIDAHMGDFDAIDRYDMTVTALRHCKSVSPAKVAQVTFGGWCHGDAVVVSKEWAEANGIHNVGDKISDFHGNKGVVSLIVDRNMSLEDAQALKIEEPVKWFAANPHLDVVMSPYSAVSRFNGGLYREALSHPSENLYSPDGKEYEGGLGQLDMIIMEQTADKKSTDYTDDEEVQTASRNFGGQTGWSLGSNGAVNILQEAFDDNTRSVVTFREMLIATGMDLDETGTLRVGYQPHEGEERAVFETKPLIMKTKMDRTTNERVPDIDSSTGRQKVDLVAMRTEFGLGIEQEGGMMELPFPIRFPAGKAMDKSGATLDMGSTPLIPDEDRSDASKAAYAGPVYCVPIMSAYLRSGQEFSDGTSRVHDYTGQYMRLYECGVKYREAKEAGVSEAELAKIQAQGQQEYNKITDDLIGRKFSGKKNVIRTTLLSAKQDAFTAVITPDPRLDLEQVSLNPEMAKAMRVREGEKIITWRDPLLTRTGMSSNVVKFDESQRCMGVSPFTGEDKDADHDGDTEGMRKVNSEEGRREADNQMNIKNRLLKTLTLPDENGEYELSVDSGEDHEGGLIMRPELRDVYNDLKHRINAFERDGRDGKISEVELDVKRKGALSELNSYVHAVQDASFGAHAISYTNTMECFKSIEGYVLDGAKGNAKKLDTFGRYLGVTYERDANGAIDYSTFENVGENVASAQEKLDPLDARNMQQAYTGPAGGQTIQSMVFAASATDRDFTRGWSARKVTAAEIMDAFTGTNKSVTQAVLQVKHSASQAREMEEVIQNYLSSAAAGYKLEKQLDPSTGLAVWERARDENNKPYQATPKEYIDQMTDIYENALGVHIVPEKIAIMADFLTDPDTGKIMTPEKRRELAPPLQRMAYDGAGDEGFATIQKMAHEGRNLYEGSPNLNSAMMPKALRNNVRAKEYAKEPENFLDEFEREQEGITDENKPQVRALTEHRVRETAVQQHADSAVRTVNVKPAKPQSRDLSGVDLPFDADGEVQADDCELH